jgi:transposase
MVWQREVLGYKYQTVAANLNVDLSTVWRVVKLFQNFGSVDKKHYSRSVSQKLTPPLELHLLHCVLMNPGIYLREIEQDLYETTGTEVSPSAICRFFQRVGLSRQKLKLVAKQQDDILRARFSCDVAMYKPEMFIFLDETGSNKRNSLRKYGYSLRGNCKPAVSQKLMVRGKSVSAIAFMSVCARGMLDLKIVELRICRRRHLL